MIPCKNPQHPGSLSKTDMQCVKETETETVWACRACMEVNRVYSVQVRTKPKYQKHIRQELAKGNRLPNNPNQQRFR